MILFLSACRFKSGVDQNKDGYDFENHGVLFYEKLVIFPEPTSLIEINIDTLEKELPESKKDGDLDVILTINVLGVQFKTFGKIKVQGSSTAKWPKKNWTLQFFKDKERTEKYKLKFGNSIASDMWITKADWNDPTQLRNALSFKLWEAMTESRNIVPQYEVDNAWYGFENIEEGIQSSARGFPYHYISEVKVNGEHYGISLLLLGHDPNNFNIDSTNPNHMYFEFDARGGEDTTKTWEKFSSNGLGTWIDNYLGSGDDINERQRKAIDYLGDVINGSLEDFKNNFNEVFDKTNMIDMLLFLELIYDYDAVAQDIEIVTYDLKKWYFLPWDKDTTFGMDWKERGIREGSETKLLFDYDEEIVTQKPWFKTYHAFTNDVEKRYAQVRDEDIISVVNLSRIIADISKKIPAEIWESERLRWPDRPSVDETSPAQILKWFESRLVVLDEHFNYKGK